MRDAAFEVGGYLPAENSLSGLSFFIMYSKAEAEETAVAETIVQYLLYERLVRYRRFPVCRREDIER